MTDGISNNLKSTLAYQIAAKLDAQDGADGQISKSIWDGFVADKGGKTIDESIDLKSAMNSITTYLVRQAKSAGQTVDTLAKDWLGKVNSSETPASGETKKSGGTQQAATAPPTKAPISDVPQKKTFPPAENIPEKDPNPPQISEPNMKGKPDSVVKQKDGTTYYYISDGRLDHIENSEGNWIQDFGYNDDGSIEYYARYEYDANGNNTRTIYYTPNVLVSHYCDKTYNSNNQETSSIRRTQDGRVEGSDIYEVEYNADGKETRTVYYNSDGSVKNYEDYEYGANGKKTRAVRCDASGNVKEYTVYEYGTNGKKTRAVRCDASGNVKEYTVYEYDKDGYYTGSTLYNPDGTKRG